MKKKKTLSIITSLTIVVLLLAGCGSTGATPNASSSGSTPKTTFKDGMVTDIGGVNDQSFNQGAWTGLQKFGQENPGVQVKYLESTQSSDYSSNLNQFSSNNYNLVWAIGYLMADAVTASAKAYPKVNFAIIDDSITPTPDNLSCVLFRAQESSFEVGYMAALKTKTDKVGFIGGVTGTVIDEFEYGFRAGVAYGAKELGKNIAVNVQYANSFSDASLGKAIAQNMYAQGADIIFAAAGNVGQGMITEAKAENKLCEGVDMDQSGLAPNNVLTSAMKNVNDVVGLISKDVLDGKKVGGKTISYGLKEGGVGIPYTDQAIKMAGQDVITKVKAVQQEIIDGKIIPPSNKATYTTYLDSLK
ncbi:MAG: BMP family ABC transporter substrate-binding protein [Desulfosporosinus sp.]|nr:BMP family ABC transporter substrate-binding protein [Desulfosporosinus sp.]